MTITIHAQGAERKRLVQTISDWLGVPAKYCGAPTFNYEVDYFTIDRNGSLSFDDRADSEVIERLLQHIYDEDFDIDQSHTDAEDEPCAVCISMPRSLFTDSNLENLKALTTAKGSLIKKALGVADLPLEITDMKVSFPWFPVTPTPEELKAYDTFMSLTSTDMRSGDLFYEAAQCQRQLQAPDTTIIHLLDSAVAAQPRDITAAPFVLERGLTYYRANKLRPAFIDFCQYDSLMKGRGTHTFYYIKYQCENKMHLYQQALNDIAHAIVLNRAEPTYYAEMASVQLKVGQNENAIQTTDLALQVTDQDPDIFIIRGIAFGEMKQKDKALEALNKAKALGDERADKLIEKYK